MLFEQSPLWNKPKSAENNVVILRINQSEFEWILTSKFFISFKKASAIVFHAYNFGGPVPEQRTPNQLYVLFNLESPYVTNSNGFPSADFFNLTMSYRAADATNLHAPYGGLHRVDWSKRGDVKDMWTEKEVNFIKKILITLF